MRGCVSAPRRRSVEHPCARAGRRTRDRRQSAAPPPRPSRRYPTQHAPCPRVRRAVLAVRRTAPAGRVAVHQHHLVDTLRVHDSELDRGQRTIALSNHAHPVDTDCVEHRERIVDPIVEIALPRLRHRIRHPRTAMVEHDHPQTRSQGTRPAQMAGVLPNRVNRGPELREKPNIGRTVTPDDVRDPVPAHTHELRLGPSHRPGSYDHTHASALVLRVFKPLRQCATRCRRWWSPRRPP